jgi:tetratricopeptide (TPR) repeat protein
MEIMNAAKTKFGDVFAVNNGLSFAYSAKGDYKKAQEHAEKALTQAPEAQKAAINTNIAKLKEGKDINQ